MLLLHWAKAKVQSVSPCLKATTPNTPPPPSPIRVGSKDLLAKSARCLMFNVIGTFLFGSGVFTSLQVKASLNVDQT